MEKDLNIIDISFRVDSKRFAINGVITDSKLLDLFIQSVSDGCSETIITMQNNAVKADCHISVTELKKMYEYNVAQ